MILAFLQDRGRMKRNRIAEQVGLSVPSVSERMRKLEERGVITGYHAVVDAKRLHIDITAFIRVEIEGPEYDPSFRRLAAEGEAIQEIHLVTGDGSYLLKVRTHNTQSLERLLAQLQSWPGVRGTSTSIVLNTYKETRALRIRPVAVLYSGQ